MIYKVVDEMIIGLHIEEIVFTMKMIDLNIKIFIEKTKIAFIFEIDSNNVYIEIALID